MKTPEELIQIAEKKRKPSNGIFSFFFTPDFAGAADLYDQAGNQYKLLKNWEKASEAFYLASQMCQKDNDRFREANLLVQAAQSAKKYSIECCLNFYNNACDIYNEKGFFGQSAKIMKSLAESYEGEGFFNDAIKYYYKAASLFEMDDYGKSQYSNCIIKYANLISQHDTKYLEAIKIFEIEADKSLKDSLLQFGAKNYFLKCILLYILLYDDLSDASIALSKYESLDHKFSLSREFKFLSNLINSLQKNDLEEFTVVMVEYDSLTRLDNWILFVITKIHEKYDKKSFSSTSNALLPKENKFIPTTEEEIDLS